MKELIYCNIPGIGGGVIEEGTIDGYNWMIVSYSSHPCAYVQLQKDHPYYKENYEFMEIDVHGGITYGQDGFHPNFPGIDPRDGFWIGWDYNHCFDFNALAHPVPREYEKMWTTEEIFEDVKSVIEQLKEIKLVEGE